MDGGIAYLKRKGYCCGDTIDEVFDEFSVTEKDQALIKRVLFKDGYTEKGICYGASMGKNKILSFLQDSRFASIFINEVRKYALKPGDPKWSTRDLKTRPTKTNHRRSLSKIP